MKLRKGASTNLQKKAVDNIMSGDYKSKGKALRAAGVSASVARNPGTFIQQEGVQNYLKNFEAKAVVKFGVSLDEKIQDVYLDGLEAEKPSKLLGVMPDHRLRKLFADTIQETRGLLTAKKSSSSPVFNFFMFDKESRSKFNEGFSEFIREKAMETPA